MVVVAASILDKFLSPLAHRRSYARARIIDENNGGPPESTAIHLRWLRVCVSVCAFLCQYTRTRCTCVHVHERHWWFEFPPHRIEK